MDNHLRDLGLAELEWQAWQNVVQEFREAVGDINDPRYNALIKAVQLWGEYLSVLRSAQSEEVRKTALGRCMEDYKNAQTEPKSVTEGALNPVTFRDVRMRGSDEKVALTVGRLHLGVNDRREVPDGMHRLVAKERLEKLIFCVMWEGDKEMTKRLGEMILDEDHFIRGLKLLFPKGELNKE